MPQALHTRGLHILRPHHSSRAGVAAAQKGYLLIGRGGRHHFVHEPAVAQGRGIHHRRIVRTENYISGVQHIENRRGREILLDAAYRALGIHHGDYAVHFL